MRLATCSVLAAWMLSANTIADSAPTNTNESKEKTIEELVVIAKNDTRVVELAETINVNPDSAALLRKAVGANVVSNGPLTGIAQYRGMGRFRVNTQVNDIVISAGGPNWMDPPLSYAPAAHLESLEVYRGITSVSAGMETIGGVIAANTWRGAFSDRGLSFDGRLRTGTEGVNNAQMYSAATTLANETQLLHLSGLRESADDAKSADGKILPTEYERDRIDVGYGLRLGPHTLRIDYGVSNTGDAGTPALPMDIQYIDADLWRFAWQYSGDALQLDAKVHTSEIKHGMTNHHLRQPPASPAMWRRNIATGDNQGFNIVATIGDWKFGIDGHDERHNSDIDNPNNPMFFVTNFNDSERILLGAFAERNVLLGDRWQLETGVRYNRVKMDSKAVNATPAVMGMPPAIALRDTFNNADRTKTDHNFDWVAKVNYQANSALGYYAGISRKTRSPAYQERFLWLPLQATAGLADGRTYTGNLELDPEVAHEVELGIEWRSERFAMAPRVFYRDVEDYIQGTVSTNMAANMFVQMMNMMNGTNNAAPLEFNNVDAKFYGVDLDWSYQFDSRWAVHGVMNFVRGERKDINDDLYRIAAPNAMVAVDYGNARWGGTLEVFLYNKQNRVSATNSEPTTGSYAVANLEGFVAITHGLRLGFGVSNLFDKNYADHLGGINRVAGNPDIARGERLPANGRSAFARLDYRW